ncbi:MAG: glycosyltransferase domain-containing protein [Blastocatellia bacterium]
MMLRNIQYDTTPIVIHSPGPIRRRLFHQVKSGVLSSPRPVKTGDLDITIFTWNNKPQKGCFERSLEALGLDYIVLGKEVAEWRNVVKIALNHEFLKRVQTTYVMAADSSDVVLLGDPRRLVERMEALPGCRMLFNAERNHYPGRCRSKKFEQQVFKQSTRGAVLNGGKDFCYLNSGAWVARTDFCRSLHEEALHVKPPLSRSDQGVYKLLYKRHYPSIQIDHDCQVFLTLCKTKTKEFEVIA